MDEQSVWDDIVRSQNETRATARKAMTFWRTLDQLPQQELVRIFRALCNTDEELDPQLHYRRRVLDLIRSEYLPELYGLRVPISIAWEVERRMWVVDRHPADLLFSGDVDIVEKDD
jgi:hypothetical protein